MTQAHCKPKHLKRLLSGSLTDEVAVDVADHVECCDTCRMQLETLAADETWWQDAHRFLSDEEESERTHVAPVYVDDSPTTGDTIQLSVVADEVETTPDELVLDLLDSSDRPDALGRLGEFDLLEVIGRGGMGIVFKAYDRKLKRHLAIKILAPHFASSAAARKRFAREARAAAAVVHPHVVAIHAVEGAGRLPYLVMPYVSCESLQERIDRQGGLPIQDVLQIGSEAARGLAAAHDQGLVHRDIKPANILLEAGTDRVLLTDFGLARAIDDAALTRSGIIVGTPQYMSPEQAKGEAIDRRTDLFSLGSVLYAMCAGHPPFRAETTMGVLRRLCDGTSIPIRESNPDVPAWLVAMIDKLLEKEPQDRYENAGDVASLLEDCLAHVHHPASAPLPASLQPANNKRGLSISATGGVGVAISFVVILVMLALLITNDAQPRQAEKRDHDDSASQADGPPEPATASDAAGQTTTSFREPDADWHDGLEFELSEIELRLQTLETEDF